MRPSAASMLTQSRPNDCRKRFCMVEIDINNAFVPSTMAE